jgi:ADP-heptose:LPS heptosyltransferase
VAQGPGLKIGIAWQGSPAADLDAGRSIPLTAFRPLTEIEGVSLISLQKGFGEEQVATCGFGESVAIPEALDADGRAFVDTAHLMGDLDLIICSDTAVAHLAGALGRPVWVALQKHAEWRWLRDRDDSPWYPTMRLFRQQSRGDWGEVFARITQAVRRQLAEG